MDGYRRSTQDFPANPWVPWVVARTLPGPLAVHAGRLPSVGELTVAFWAETSQLVPFVTSVAKWLGPRGSSTNPSIASPVLFTLGVSDVNGV
jgi:hypothetical protein